MQSGVVRFGIAAAAMMSSAMLATSVHAYTDNQQQLCSDDAFRLCGPAIPDVDRVTACMIQNQSLLSPGCAQFFRTPTLQMALLTARKASERGRRKRKRRAESSLPGAYCES
jgi:hypothetical protein